VVVDAFTKAPIKDVSVKLPAEGKSAKTDAQGTAVFKGLRVGEYTIIVEKAGYATFQVADKLIEDVSKAVNKGTFVAGDGAGVVELIPTNASLEGYLFYNKDGVNVPAKGAIVRITFGDEFEPSIYDIEVDENGKYSIAELPAIGCKATVLPIEFGGALYSVPDFDVALLPNAKKVVPAEILGVANSGDFVLVSYTGKVKPNEAIKLEFSKAVDLSTASGIFSSTIPHSMVWSDGNKKLSIELFGGNEWLSNQEVNGLNSLKSVGGEDLVGSNTRSIKIDWPDLNLVEGLEWVDRPSSGTTIAEHEISSLELSWKKVDYATHYNVYIKASKGSQQKYVKVNTADISGTSATVSLSGLGLTATTSGTASYESASGDDANYYEGYYPATAGDYVGSTYPDIVEVGTGNGDMKYYEWTYYIVANGDWDCTSLLENGHECKDLVDNEGFGGYGRMPYDDFDDCGSPTCGDFSSADSWVDRDYVRSISSGSSYSLHVYIYDAPGAGNIGYATGTSPIYCTSDYCNLKQVTSNDFKPFANDGKLEIVVQAINSNNGDKTSLDAANREPKSKLTLP
jgi:hypothetical protein